MSNSTLIDNTLISPYTSARTYPISKITIHCSAGISDAEAICRVVKNREVSCNYAIGVDGDICLGAGEDRRAWCTGNYDNDHRAINIEVSNSDIKDPDLPVSDKSIESLIKLCVDICKRNGIQSLDFTGDSSGNLTAHRFFANKSCPGDYLYDRLPAIADTVNTILQEDKPMTTEEKKSFNDLTEKVENLTHELESANAKLERVQIKYNWFDAIPEYAKPLFAKLMQMGILKGDETGQLGLTDDVVRTFVLLDRIGVLKLHD